MKYYAIYILNEFNESCVVNILQDYNLALNFCNVIGSLSSSEKHYIHEFEATEPTEDFSRLLDLLENEIDRKGEHKVGE